MEEKSKHAEIQTHGLWFQKPNCPKFKVGCNRENKKHLKQQEWKYNFMLQDGAL